MADFEPALVLLCDYRVRRVGKDIFLKENNFLWKRVFSFGMVGSCIKRVCICMNNVKKIM